MSVQSRPAQLPSLGPRATTVRRRQCSAGRNVQTILDVRLFCFKVKAPSCKFHLFEYEMSREFVRGKSWGHEPKSSGPNPWLFKTFPLFFNAKTGVSKSHAPNINERSRNQFAQSARTCVDNNVRLAQSSLPRCSYALNYLPKHAGSYYPTCWTYSGSSITLNSCPHADSIFGLELLSKPVFGALRRDVFFVA